MRLFIVSCLLFIGISVTYGQEFKTKAITTADGLSQGYINTIFQDSRGFIWIGTPSGLNRYDGYEVKTYADNDKLTLALGATAIFSIIETSDGLLWLGTSRGLVVFNTYTDQVLPVYEYLEHMASGAFDLLEVDEQGNIWFKDMIAQDKQLNVIRPASDLAQKMQSRQVTAADFGVKTIAYESSISQPIQRFLVTRNNTILAIDSKDQLCKINIRQYKASRSDISAFEVKREGLFGTIPLLADKRGMLFRLHSDTMSTLPAKAYLRYLQTEDGTRHVIHFADKKLFALDGLSKLSYEYKHIAYDFFKQLKVVQELDAGISNTFMVDKQGNIWIGTLGFGVRVIYKDKSLYKHTFDKVSIMAMIPVTGNKFWPGLYGSNRIFDIDRDTFDTAPWVRAFPELPLVYNYFISSNGDEWLLFTSVSTSYALFHKKRRDNTWSRAPIQLAHSVEEPVLFYEHIDKTVWIIGNMGEIYRYQPENQQYEKLNIRNKFPTWQQDRIRGLTAIPDKGDLIWVGVIGGLIKIEHASTSPTFQVYHNNDKQQNTHLFSNEEIIALYADDYQHNILWIGTRGGGLIRFDKESQETKVYNTRDGLLNNVVYSILPDEEHRFWISTNKGISIFYPETGKFINAFSPKSDISTEFNTNAYLKLPDGRMAFGSVNGLFVINPKAVKIFSQVTTVALSGIKINGTPLNTFQDTRLSQDNEGSYLLQTSHDQNNISLNFSALPVSAANDVLYRYRIPKLQASWIDMGAEHILNLTALPYGKHTLEMQSSVITGKWKDAPITRVYIHVLRPWYISPPAWIAYGIITIIFSYLIYGYYQNKIVTDRALRTNQMEAERLKIQEEFKNRFFSYVAHEFKTPLTLIMGMSQRLKQYPVPDNITESLSFQAGNLNELVNQLIDIGKSERKTLKLEITQLNISNFVQYLVESLRQLAESGGINLTFFSTVPDLVTDIDPVRLKYVINNLLTNAFRHTPEGGQVEVKLGMANEQQLLMTIADSGEGISEEDLPMIFQRHFQGQSSYYRHNTFGLGLAFVKDLIFMFNGDIDVQSKPGLGTIFTITLPISQRAPLSEKTPLEATVSGKLHQLDEQYINAELPIILIVEDNQSMSVFLNESLSPHFNVLQAANGRAGYDLAVQQLPDIILTDLVMPIMDGFELTALIKQNVLTAHIPVVMVSAQAALEQRLSSHHLGVDAFIPKPFHEQELVLILLNMITLQQRWKERYSSQHAADQSKMTNNIFFSEHEHIALKKNDQFMDQLYTVFEANFSNEDFDRDFLCHELHLSKSQLHRKLSAISSLPAMELLRKFRLEKAYAIIEHNPDLHIREICFMVGMKHPAHFTSLFTQLFGISPSELKKLIQLKKM
jgi:signal transduction histidine kinase/DNA-binding response OmpR family regulator/sugar lactone lactonase YvrE